MEVKRISLFVIAALVGTTLLVPLAAVADDGLTVIVFVTPPGVDVDGTIDVNVEVYYWDQLVDVEAIAGMAGSHSIVLNFTNVTTGKYHANYTIEAGAASFGTLVVHVQATLGILEDEGSGFYTLPSAPPPPASWTVRARIANMNEVGMAPSSGETVVVEARSYLGATLADGGAINASASHYEGLTLRTEALNGTRTSVGVFRFNYLVPAGMTTSTMFDIEASLGTGFSAPYDTVSFTVDPIPVIVYIASQSATSASLRVYVGGASAVAGATVSLEGEGFTFTPPYFVTVGPFNGTTNAAGFATIDGTWAASSFLTFTLTVTSAGKTTTMPMFFGSTTPGGWVPPVNSPFGCSMRLQSDPSTIQPGTTATLKFHLTLDGDDVASRQVTRWVWHDFAVAGPEQSGNATTDASGNFTVTYALSSNFTEDDTLVVMAICPSGETASVDVHILQTFGAGGHVDITLGTATVGGSVPVTATLTGASVPDGAYAYATIVPGASLSAAVASQGAHLPSVELTRAGATFTGNVSVPSWLPSGDYVVVVTVSNSGSASNLAQETQYTNASTVNVAPASGNPNPPPPGPAPKGFLPGFEGAAALAAVCAGALVLTAGRRRRSN